MRWTLVFIYLAVVTVVTILVAQVVSSKGWLAVVIALLLLPLIVWRAFVSRDSVSWASVLSHLSAVSLLSALASQVEGWTVARGWLLLLWTLFLLGVAVSLFAHPMRRPAWGLFVGFWGVVGVLWLMIIQGLAVADVLTGPAYAGWAAWPLALIGIWFLVASATGFGAEPFGPLIDALGVLAGLGLLGIAVSTWAADQSDVQRAVDLVAAVVYSAWAFGLGWAMSKVDSRSRRLAVEPMGSRAPA